MNWFLTRISISNRDCAIYSISLTHVCVKICQSYNLSHIKVFITLVRENSCLAVFLNILYLSLFVGVFFYFSNNNLSVLIYDVRTHKGQCYHRYLSKSNGHIFKNFIVGISFLPSKNVHDAFIMHHFLYKLQNPLNSLPSYL
jgi:hypothetical protein